MFLKDQRDDAKRILKLMQDNPDLPIIPVVDADVVASDEYRWWVGSWNGAEIDFFVEGKESCFFKNENDAEDIMKDFYGGESEDWPDDEFEAKYAALPWVKCIKIIIGI